MAVPAGQRPSAVGQGSRDLYPVIVYRDESYRLLTTDMHYAPATVIGEVMWPIQPAGE